MFMSLLQAGCTNNVRQSERNKVDDPINVMIEESADDDSIYYLCSEKFKSLIVNPDDKHFFDLENDFFYTDEYNEFLLYSLAAANKLGLDVAKIRVACCLTESLSNPDIGKNSKKIALLYLNNGKFITKHKRGKQIIERLESSSKEDIDLITPKITSKSSVIQRLKAGCLKGSVDDYRSLKEKLYNDKKYAFLLYYSYIMADRYDYLPAKKDVIAIITRFYKENGLGSLDKDTKYFCSFFE